MKCLAVYLCGDEFPTALFPYYDDVDRDRAMERADEFPAHQPRWMDKMVVDLDLPGAALERSKLDPKRSGRL